MSSRLEQFVNEVDVRLTALTPEVREQEIAEIRQHLQAIAAAEEALGASEAEAAEAAIRQFGVVGQIATELNATGRRSRLKRLPETAVTALCALTATPFIGLAVRTLIPPPQLGAHAPEVSHLPGMFCWLLCILAAAILILRDGGRVTLQRMTSLRSPSGVAVWWLFALNCLGAMANAVFIPLLRLPVVNDVPQILLFCAIANFCSVVLPAAGLCWIAERLAPRKALGSILTAYTTRWLVLLPLPLILKATQYRSFIGIFAESLILTLCCCVSVYMSSWMARTRRAEKAQ